MVVFLVTYDGDWGQATQHSLARCGVEIRLVEPDGKAIAQACVECPPDLVLVDIQDAGARFMGWIGAIRSACPLTEFVVLGEGSEATDGVAAVRSGAFEYVPKWVPAEALYSKIGRAVRRKRASEERLRQLGGDKAARRGAHH
jgi:DNA-binding NtrC family response regulator